MARSLTVLLLVVMSASCSPGNGGGDGPPAGTSAMLPLVPRPAAVEPQAGGPFPVTATTTIRVEGGVDAGMRIAGQLASLIGRAAGPEPLRVTAGPPADGAINLVIGEIRGQGDDAYELEVTAARVTVRARHPAGLFRGVQTLRQLLPPFLEHRPLRFEKDRPITAPAVRIEDAPRFPWRGAMLDVARHFFGIEDVQRYIDLLALYKLNRLHLHLSDDQGWRIDIAAWPNLTRHGGSTQVGGGPGGYFTQEDYAAIVRYAAERFITVVPEIDMPGHTNAALASYPDLNCDGQAPPLHTGIEVGFSTLCVDREITYRFIDDVVREIAALTPGPYFHIGGDEVEKLTRGQYRRFIERVQHIVQAHGKETIGWDEIAAAKLLPTTIVQHWRPDASAQAGMATRTRVIVSVANRAYLDMKYTRSTPLGLSWAGLIEVRDAYDWEPAAAGGGLPEEALLGVEAPLWTETIASIRDVEKMAFPRLAALAEVAWSRADRRQWDDFSARLGMQAPRWSALGVNYYRSPQIRWVD